MKATTLNASPEPFVHELQEQWKVIQLTDTEIQDLEWFIQNFDDFFMLCEGDKGSAQGLLTCSPPSIDPEKDKFVLGIYEEKKLIGAIDVIRNYPLEGVWTIGYLLIHPAYQRKRVGYNFMKALEKALMNQNAIKLRCGVQEQNPNALKFWLKCNFKIIDRIQETLGKSTHHTHVLEKSLLPLRP